MVAGQPPPPGPKGLRLAQRHADVEKQFLGRNRMVEAFRVIPHASTDKLGSAADAAANSACPQNSTEPKPVTGSGAFRRSTPAALPGNIRPEGIGTAIAAPHETVTMLRFQNRRDAFIVSRDWCYPRNPNWSWPGDSGESSRVRRSSGMTPNHPGGCRHALRQRRWPPNSLPFIPSGPRPSRSICGPTLRQRLHAGQERTRRRGSRPSARSSA